MKNIIRCGTVEEAKDAMSDRTLTSEPNVFVVNNYTSPRMTYGIKLAFSSAIRDGGSSIYGSSAIPLYEYRKDSEASLEDYLGQAESLWLGHRMLMAAFEDPVRRLMAEFGLAFGAQVIRLELLNKPCFFGQFRCFTEREDVEPHVDIIEREFPSLLQAPLRQWALNVAICASEVGGELQIWDHIPSFDEYRGYGLTRPSGTPVVTFKPSPGDFYFFAPKFVHAITASHGPRCALAGFLAEWPENQIRVWS